MPLKRKIIIVIIGIFTLKSTFAFAQMQPNDSNRKTILNVNEGDKNWRKEIPSSSNIPTMVVDRTVGTSPSSISTDSNHKATAVNFLAKSKVQPGNFANNINIRSFVDNYGKGLAIANLNEGFRENGGGGVWAGIDEVQDFGQDKNETGGVIGREIDVRAVGPDFRHRRGVLMLNVSNLIRGKPEGAAGEVAWGILFKSGGDKNQPSSGKFDVYELFQSNFDIGLDFSQVPKTSYDKPIIVMAPGQKIMFNTRNGNAWQYDPGANGTGKMEYISKDGNILFSIDDNGNATFNGDIVSIGHDVSQGGQPKVTSGTLELHSTDSKGVVEEEQGATGFSLVFSIPYKSAPTCIISSPSGSSFLNYQTSPAGIILNNAVSSRNVYAYLCEE